MSDIVIRPEHNPIPGTADVPETASSSDPDLAALAKDLFFVKVEPDPYDPKKKEVIEIPVSVRGSLDYGTYLRHRRTLGIDSTVGEKGGFAKSGIVIGPSFKDAGLAFAGPVSSGAGIFLDFDIDKHQYVIRGKDNPHAGKLPGFTLPLSDYSITKDAEIRWHTEFDEGIVLKDVGEAAYASLENYLQEKKAGSKPISIQDTMVVYPFFQQDYYWLISKQEQAFQKLKNQNRIEEIPPIHIGEILVVKEEDSYFPALCLDKKNKEIIFPPPKNWKEDTNIELINSEDLKLINKETAKVHSMNFLAETLMPWLAKENDEAAMVALVRFGFLTTAKTVDIKNQEVTFENANDAFVFMNTLFGVNKRKELPDPDQAGATQASSAQQLVQVVSAETYTTPLNDGLHFWFFEGAKVTVDMMGGKGTDDNAIWSIAAFDDVRFAVENPTESAHDYAGYFSAESTPKPPDGIQRQLGFVPPKGQDRRYQAVALPILTNVETGETKPIYWDTSYYTRTGIQTVMDNYQIPEGYRLPTEEELYEYVTKDAFERYDIPPKPGFAMPMTGEFGTQITVVKDEYMIRLVNTAHGNPMPVAFCEPHYQPLTQIQDIGGQVMGKDNKPEKHPGWITLSGWYNYEQGHLLKVLCQMANSSAEGFEGSVRRMEEDGFRYENPDGGRDWMQDLGIMLDRSWLGLPLTDAINWTGRPPVHGAEKVARYACHYNVGYFGTKIAEIEGLIAGKADTDNIVLDGEPISVAGAKEIIHGLRLAWKGPVEKFAEWYARNWELLSTGLVTTCLLLIAFNWKSIKASVRNLLGRSMKSPAIHMYRQQAYTDGIREHKLIGRTEEMRAIFRYYYDLMNNDQRPYKMGTLHSPGGSGKTWLIEGMGEALHLGIYPDGTPMEPEYRRMFGEVMELNVGELVQSGGNVGVIDVAGAKIRAAISYAQNYHSRTGRYCIIFIDEFFDNLIARGEIYTDEDGRQRTRPYMDAIFKQLENQPVIFGIATRNLHQNVSRTDEQIVRRARIIPVPRADGTLASYENGMDELQPYYVLRVLTNMVQSMMSDTSYSCLAVEQITDSFLRNLIMSAQTRAIEGDPDRSVNELRNYLNFLRTHAEQQGTRVVATWANYLEYVRRHPGPGTDHPNIQGRRPITDDDFNRSPFRVRGRPQAPNIQKPPGRQNPIRRFLDNRRERARRNAARSGRNGSSTQARPRPLAQERIPDEERATDPGLLSPPRPRGPGSGGPQARRAPSRSRGTSSRRRMPAPGRGTEIPSARLPATPPVEVASAPAISPVTRAHVEAALYGVRDIVSVDDLLELGFNEGQMLEFIRHMREHPNATLGMLYVPWTDKRAPEIILQRLNDKGFMAVAGQNYVTPAMVPTVLGVYTGQISVQPGQYISRTGSLDLSGPQDPGDIPASHFLPGAGPYVHPTPPRPATLGPIEQPVVDHAAENTDLGPNTNERLLTQIDSAFQRFSPTQDLYTMLNNVERWCRANRTQGGTLGDFLLVTLNTVRSDLLAQHPALGFVDADLVCVRVLQATVTVLQNPRYAAMDQGALRLQLRNAIVAQINTDSGNVRVNPGQERNSAVGAFNERMNRLADTMMSSGITSQMTGRTRSR